MPATIKEKIKKDIIRLCYKETQSIPRISHLHITGKVLKSGLFFLQEATCEVKDVYTCLFTHKKKTDVYSVSYDGKSVKMTLKPQDLTGAQK